MNMIALAEQERRAWTACGVDAAYTRPEGLRKVVSKRDDDAVGAGAQPHQVAAVGKPSDFLWLPIRIPAFIFTRPVHTL